MALRKIPVRNDLPNYTMRVDLNSVIFILEFRYNERADRWVMDVQTEEAETIIQGVVLVTGVPLLSQYVDERLPEGDFVVLDRAGENINPTRDNFGEDVELYYNEIE